MSMQVDFASLGTCHAATGVVVVIDVCRAFTSAAYALGSGAERIFLTGSAEDALVLRARFPGALVMGEVEGLPAAGFDFWNSPSQLALADLHGKTMIQRTSAGTQGIVRAIRAEHLLAGSFAVAGATARAIQKLKPRSVTFVITGGAAEDARYGLEDRACAEYIAALLRDENPDVCKYMQWEADFRAVHQLDELPGALRGQFEADLLLCRQADRFLWSLPVRREGDLLIMSKSIG